MHPIPAARIVIPAEDRRQILACIDEARCTGPLTPSSWFTSGGGVSPETPKIAAFCRDRSRA